MGLRLRFLFLGVLLATTSQWGGVYARDEPSSSLETDHESITNHYIPPNTGDPTILLTHTQRLNNQTLLWGPYRPQVYFGIKPRLPDSFIAGLMWSNVDDYTGLKQNFRHTCEQGDELEGYGWERYDVRSGGVQMVRDKGNGVDLEIEWRKVEGGGEGGHWGVRVKGTLREDVPKDTKTALWFYAGLEGEGDIHLANDEDELGLEGDVTLGGHAPGLGKFHLTITPGPQTNKHPPQEHQASLSKPLDRTLYKSFELPFEKIWKTKDILFMHIQDYLQRMMGKFGKEDHPPAWDSFTLSNEYGDGNLHMVQKTFMGSFEFDILYTSESAETEMTSELLTQKITEFEETYPARFDAAFKLQTPFNTPEYTEFAQNMFSNLIGGIGYFHGTTLVDRSNADEYAEEDEGFWEGVSAALKNADVKTEGPYSLFTSIPSRPFFPRGFYWDEGFQLLPMLEWDVDLALEIIKSWFSLVDEDGWIAREQILGDEARSKVPSEFQVQYPHHANPPTLFIAITEFILKFEAAEKKRASENLNVDHQSQKPLGGSSFEDIRNAHLSRPLTIHFLKSIYPNLRRHYFWFRKTQLGDLKSFSHNAPYPKEAFRWRGRTPTHCLASGLDDYPRAVPPHTGELHVDLISWMSVMARCLRKIAVVLDEGYKTTPELFPTTPNDDSDPDEPSPYASDITTFITHETRINKNLHSLHWSAEHNLYCDVTISPPYDEPTHVCHPGYISLFPFLVGGILPPDSPHLPHLLDILTNPTLLSSPYGIRSLSPTDPSFKTGENYWRGNIWINMNYLVLQRLLEYARTPGPNQKRAREAYLDLRKGVVENIYNEWKRTGFAWEQYDEETGEGRRTKHFLGWTSLVVGIMGMPGEVSLVQKEYQDWAV